mmetsp:Transcript_90119/g.255200  ORF Transcript_90119/g.255200 Transcript_90119/m.255200 type:complete len:247 (+) Transcript_90119:43-783(+)
MTCQAGHVLQHAALWPSAMLGSVAKNWRDNQWMCWLHVCPGRRHGLSRGAAEAPASWTLSPPLMTLNQPPAQASTSRAPPPGSRTLPRRPAVAASAAAATTARAARAASARHCWSAAASSAATAARKAASSCRRSRTARLPEPPVPARRRRASHSARTSSLTVGGATTGGVGGRVLRARAGPGLRRLKTAATGRWSDGCSGSGRPRASMVSSAAPLLANAASAWRLLQAKRWSKVAMRSNLINVGP